MSDGWSTEDRGRRLREALTAAAHEHAEGVNLRSAALALLKTYLAEARSEAARRLAGRKDGLRVARFFSRETDALIAAAHAFTTVHVVRARNPTEGERLALVATGGYGRGALAPYSDIDLLFLRAWKLTPHVESVTEYLLYLLWDLGLKVGVASRGLDEAIRTARDDMTVRTAQLDARLVAGDALLFDDLQARFRHEVVRGSGPEFIAAKLRERDERHARAGESRYLVEPDVKNGKGGMRDLHTLLWIARYLHPEASDDWSAAAPLLTGEQRRRAVDASRFLWTVRCHLHLLAGRSEERLSFHWQPELAARMGYASRHRRPAAERLMRRYFLTAREVGALTRAVCAALEASAAKVAPLGLSRFFRAPQLPKRLKDKAFRIKGGRLTVKRPDAFARDPLDLLRAFRAADAANLDLHPDLVEAIKTRARRITPAVRASPQAARVFLDVLAHGRDPERTLALMTDTGVLGRYLPEWARVVGRTQFNMYHAYTVDEHSLRAVGLLADIAAGRAAEEHPLATATFPSIADPEAVFLAMLLHDVGKADPGEPQEVAGARAASTACRRLGLSEERVETVAWLVGHHLLMSDTAQKRDLTDPTVAAAFAQAVGAPERLKALLAITIADIRAVGPGVWNGWKAQLLRDLYAATMRVMGEPDDAVGVETRGPTRWSVRFDGRYRGAFDAATQAGHARLAEALAEEEAASLAEPRADLQATALTVVARDRLGLFADLCAALAAEGAGVAGAQAHTSEDGVAVDVFYLQDRAGQPFGAGRPTALSRLQGRIRRASEGDVAPPARRPGRDVAPFEIEPTVTIDDYSSPRGAIVEMTGADRPGLLADLARAAADAGVSIASAHVETLGERAVDVFYVTEPDGSRVRGAGKLSRLKAALLEALRERAPERSAA